MYLLLSWLQLRYIWSLAPMSRASYRLQFVHFSFDHMIFKVETFAIFFPILQYPPESYEMKLSPNLCSLMPPYIDPCCCFNFVLITISLLRRLPTSRPCILIQLIARWRSLLEGR